MRSTRTNECCLQTRYNLHFVDVRLREVHNLELCECVIGPEHSQRVDQWKFTMRSGAEKTNLIYM